jgi:hypothetical protein
MEVLREFQRHGNHGADGLVLALVGRSSDWLCGVCCDVPGIHRIGGVVYRLCLRSPQIGVHARMHARASLSIVAIVVDEIGQSGYRVDAVIL